MDINVGLAAVAIAAAAMVGALALGRAAVRLGRSSRLGVALGLGVGLAAPLAIMVPLNFCTFGAEATTTDLWFGLFLIAGVTAVAISMASTAIDPDAARRRRERGDDVTHGVFRGRPILPWLLLAPTLIILVLFLYWPALRTISLSTKLVRLGAPRGVDRCVTNFTELIGPTRPGWLLGAVLVSITLLFASRFVTRTRLGRNTRWAAWLTTASVAAMLITLALLWNAKYQQVFIVTMIISLGTVSGGLIISLGIAYLAYQPVRGASIYRTLLVWPYAISPPIAGLLFFVMFDANSGIIEHWLQNIFGFALPDYRTNTRLAQFVVILASIWKTLGYNLLFYIAGLQTVPKDQIEAATLDGAGALNRFRYVVLPALSPITFFLIVTNLTYAFFETFGTIDYLTAGGPARGTTVAMYEIYQVAIPGRDLGRGAAQSLILFAGVVALTLWQFRSTGRKVSYGR
jgi:sn-glycerol 3-phosphate transport system permease protein